MGITGPRPCVFLAGHADMLTTCPALSALLPSKLLSPAKAK